MTVFYVTVNRPGYSPESDPCGCETLADAREVIASELRHTAETHLDDDEDAEDAFAKLAAVIADDVAALKPGESILFAGYAHSITESDEAF